MGENRRYSSVLDDSDSDEELVLISMLVGEGQRLRRQSDGMERPFESGEQVDILSDEPSSKAEDKPNSDKPSNKFTIDPPAKYIISEDSLLKRAQMYQEYMKQIPIPAQRGSVIPFTSWTGLAASIKQLYNQPLHYLTNIRMKQLDQLRIGADDEDIPLDMLIHPSKAETTIWLTEEAHRRTSSHHHLAKLWLADPLHHSSIDPIFPSSPNKTDA